uniref:Uncharacterized protein n=1 Tax=Opuntia streptacantha TaxID=393608 RepID=A0A7C9CGL8_OPUST
MKKNGTSPFTTESHLVRVSYKETRRRAQTEGSMVPENCCGWMENQSTHKVAMEKVARIGPTEHEPRGKEKSRRAEHPRRTNKTSRIWRFTHDRLGRMKPKAEGEALNVQMEIRMSKTAAELGIHDQD